MDDIKRESSVTSASSLLGDSTLLPGNGSQPLKLSCAEYVTYVDELLRNVAQLVLIISQIVAVPGIQDKIRPDKIPPDSGKKFETSVVGGGFCPGGFCPLPPYRYCSETFYL